MTIRPAPLAPTDPVIKRARGRPRGEPHVMASTWLTVRDYDRLIRLANAREASVSAVMRHVVILLLNEEK